VAEGIGGDSARPLPGAVTDMQALRIRQGTIDRPGRQHRHVLVPSTPGHREPTTRFGRAEQDVGESVAELLAWEPGDQHRSHLVPPRHRHRAIGIDHDDGAGVDSGHRPHQRVLTTRKTEGDPVETFTSQSASV